MAFRIHRIQGNGRKLPKINGILPKIKATKMTGNQLKCIDCSRRPNKSFFFDVQTVSSAISVFCFPFLEDLGRQGIGRTNRTIMDVSALCLTSCFSGGGRTWTCRGRVLFILI